MLRDVQARNIIGNHDRYIIDGTECPRSRSANACLAYQKRVITEANRAWLAASVATIETDEASFVHGGWRDPEDEYLYTINADYFAPLDARYFFCGHTHVQCHVRFKNRKVFTNPGSVGQPRDGDPRAAYALFDETSGEVILRRVTYEIDRVATKMQSLGFDAYFYENLYRGSRIGGRVDAIEVGD